MLRATLYTMNGHERRKATLQWMGLSMWCALVGPRDGKATPRHRGSRCLPLIYASVRAESISYVYLPFIPYANRTKKDSVGVKQNSEARAGGNFSQTWAENFHGASSFPHSSPYYIIFYLFQRRLTRRRRWRSRASPWPRISAKCSE